MYDLTCLAHISSLACIGTVSWCSRVGLQAIREMSEQMSVVLSVSAAFRVTTLLHAYFFFTVYIIYNQFSNRVWFTLRKAMIWHWALLTELRWKCSECTVLLEEEPVDRFSVLALAVLPPAGSPLTLGIVCLTGAGSALLTVTNCCWCTFNFFFPFFSVWFLGRKQLA